MILTRHFNWINLLTLAVISLLIWLNQANETHWINAPGYLIISIFLLSTAYFYFHERLNNIWKLLLSGLVFILGYYLISGTILILFQRFFRVEEQYTFQAFFSYLKANQELWLDGLWIWLLYTAVFQWIRDRVQNQSIIEINKQLLKEINLTHRKQLRREINPHFVFNAMNSIAMKVRLSENKTAVDMIAAVNDLLRVSLKPASNELITISRELELLEKYLLIERQRFDDELDLALSFQEEIYDALIPELLLQPLVENAFKHGTEIEGTKRKVQIDGYRQADQLVISVYNSTLASKMILSHSDGIGLPNIMGRLRRIYGLDFQFQSMVDDAGIAFKITIPYQSS